MAIGELADPHEWGLPSNSFELTIEPGASQLGWWEASVLARAYMAAVSAQQLRPIGVVAVGGGASNANIYVIGRSSTGTLDPDQGSSELQGLGFPIVEITTEDGATVVTMRATDPAAFLEKDAQQVLNVLAQAQANQYFFALEDAYGSVVYDDGVLANGGMMFWRPDLEPCGPAPTDFVGGYFPQKSPPRACPV